WGTPDGDLGNLGLDGGPLLEGAMFNTAMSTDARGNPVIVSSTYGKSPHVRRFNGTGWESLGDADLAKIVTGGESVGDAGGTNLLAPLGAWMGVGKDGNPVVSFAAADDQNGPDIGFARWTGTAWQSLGRPSHLPGSIPRHTFPNHAVTLDP